MNELVQAVMRTYKYLHVHPRNPNILWLDHKICPEIRAMLAAMVSRIPQGGIRRRYVELLEELIRDRYPQNMPSPYTQAAYDSVELSLTEYPLPKKVKSFLDLHVGKYGHGSVKELTGDPPLFIENISQLLAWTLFDSPLVTGQEVSTRAVSRTSSPWPMDLAQTPELKELHEKFLTLYEKEKTYWEEHFKEPENRKRLGILDKEPFRPAFDRARWLLPGTVSTSVVFTSNIRERARACSQALKLARRMESSKAEEVIAQIIEAYDLLLPGLAGYGLKEAVHADGLEVNDHLLGYSYRERGYTYSFVPLPLGENQIGVPREGRGYLDPALNAVPVLSQITGSFAVARDWHRHRTLYPMALGVRRPLQIVDAYKNSASPYLSEATELFALADSYFNRDTWEGFHAMPFGAETALITTAGLRNVVYVMELRSTTPGRNFEYAAQASTCLETMKTGMSEATKAALFPND